VSVVVTNSDSQSATLNSGFTYTAPAWAPEDLGSSLALWLDADDASTLTLSGSNVTEWRDKSGGGKHVAQGSASQQPTTTTFNGRTSLSFDGTNDLLENATVGITSGSYSGSFNVFYVATRSGVAGTLLSERSGGVVAISQWANLWGPNYLSSDGTNLWSNHTISSTVFDQLSSSGGLVVHVHVSGSRDQLWLNGASRTVDSGTANSITGPAGFRIGARELSYGQNWHGKISEVMVTTSSLDSNTRQSIEGYLAHKWGLTGSLPADHPYKASAP